MRVTLPINSDDVSVQSVSWYDEDGNRYRTPEEIAIEQQQQLQDLLARLQEKGIDLDSI